MVNGGGGEKGRGTWVSEKWLSEWVSDKNRMLFALHVNTCKLKCLNHAHSYTYAYGSVWATHTHIHTMGLHLNGNLIADLQAL